MDNFTERFTFTVAESLPLRRHGLSHRPAPDGGDGGIRSDNQAIPRACQERFLEPQLHPTGSPRRYFVAFQRDYTSHHLARAEVDAHPLSVLDGPSGVREDGEGDSQHRGRGPVGIEHEDLPALYGLDSSVRLVTETFFSG